MLGHRDKREKNTAGDTHRLSKKSGPLFGEPTGQLEPDRFYVLEFTVDDVTWKPFATIVVPKLSVSPDEVWTVAKSAVNGIASWRQIRLSAVATADKFPDLVNTVTERTSTSVSWSHEVSPAFSEGRTFRGRYSYPDHGGITDGILALSISTAAISSGESNIDRILWHNPDLEAATNGLDLDPSGGAVSLSLVSGSYEGDCSLAVSDFST